MQRCKSILKSRSAVYTIPLIYRHVSTTIFYILPSIYIVIVYVVHSCSMNINDAETQAKKQFLYILYCYGNGRLYSSSRVQPALQSSFMPVLALQLIWWKLTTVIIVITIIVMTMITVAS